MAATRKLAVIGALVVVVVLRSVSPALAGGESGIPTERCTVETNRFVRDVTTGWSWTTLWHCHNRTSANLYQDPDFHSKTAQMSDEPSWFVCYRHGAKHAGNNDIWYYTLGDVPHPRLQRRQPWGYMPAVDVLVGTHPWPGMPLCPAPIFPITIQRKPA